MALLPSCREGDTSDDPGTAPASQAASRWLAFLSRVALFQGLSADELSCIAAGVSEVRVARGDLLFRKGDRCTGFHVVVSGQIKLTFSSANGTEKVVEIMSAGQSFGEAVMFLDRPYVVNAQALRDSTLLHIGKTAMQQAIRSDSGLACRIIASLSCRLHGVVADLEWYSMHSGVQRVISYLLRGEPESDARGEPIAILLPTSKNVIASRLNMTPEYFSRVLHDLCRDGLIGIEGRKVTILDFERLRRQGVKRTRVLSPCPIGCSRPAPRRP